MASGASGNVRPVPWDLPQRQAAILVANGLTDVEVAGHVGVSDRTVRKWRHHPEFAALVDAIGVEATAGLIGIAIADKQYRITVAQDLLDRQLRLIAARAEAAKAKLAQAWDPPAAGEATGLVAVKQIGVGRQAIREAAFDAALVKSALGTLEYVAKEAGQWTEHGEVRVTHAGRVTVEHRDDALDVLSDDELDQLAALRAKLDTQEVGA